MLCKQCAFARQKHAPIGQGGVAKRHADAAAPSVPGQGVDRHSFATSAHVHSAHSGSELACGHARWRAAAPQAKGRWSGSRALRLVCLPAVARRHGRRHANYKVNWRSGRRRDEFATGPSRGPTSCSHAPLHARGSPRVLTVHAGLIYGVSHSDPARPDVHAERRSSRRDRLCTCSCPKCRTDGLTKAQQHAYALSCSGGHANP